MNFYKYDIFNEVRLFWFQHKLFCILDKNFKKIYIIICRFNILRYSSFINNLDVESIIAITNSTYNSKYEHFENLSLFVYTFVSMTNIQFILFTSNVYCKKKKEVQKCK